MLPKEIHILTPSQLGYRLHLSTDSAAPWFTDKVGSCIDNGNISGSLFIDFSNAFDCIDHNLLFCDLEWYGTTAPSLTLFKHLLFNRYEVVSVNIFASHPAAVNKGMPQCSILGHLSFALYANNVAVLPTEFFGNSFCGQRYFILSTLASQHSCHTCKKTLFRSNSDACKIDYT